MPNIAIILLLVFIICLAGIAFGIISQKYGRITGSKEFLIQTQNKIPKKPKKPKKSILMISGLPKTGKTTIAKELLKSIPKAKHIDVNHPTLADIPKIHKSLEKSDVILTGRELIENTLKIPEDVPQLHIHLSIIDYKTPDDLIVHKDNILKSQQNMGAHPNDSTWHKYIETLGNSKINEIVTVYDPYAGEYKPLPEIVKKIKELLS